MTALLLKLYLIDEHCRFGHETGRRRSLSIQPSWPYGKKVQWLGMERGTADVIRTGESSQERVELLEIKHSYDNRLQCLELSNDDWMLMSLILDVASLSLLAWTLWFFS